MLFVRVLNRDPYKISINTRSKTFKVSRLIDVVATGGDQKFVLRLRIKC